jgi:hypothetical protein
MVDPMETLKLILFTSKCLVGWKLIWRESVSLCIHNEFVKPDPTSASANKLNQLGKGNEVISNGCRATATDNYPNYCFKAER